VFRKRRQSPLPQRINSAAVQGKAKKRKRLVITGILLLIVMLISVESLVYELRSPVDLYNNLQLFTLLNVNLVIVMGLVLLVLRQLIKLYLERRRNVLGTKFKAKLVLAFVAISLLPAVALFLVTSNIVSNTIEGWFKTQNEESLKKALIIAQSYYETSLGKAFQAANEISALATRERMLDAGNLKLLEPLVRERQVDTNLGIVKIVGTAGDEIVSITNPRLPESNFIASTAELMKRGLRGQSFSIVRKTNTGNLVNGVVPIYSKWIKTDVVGVVLFNYYDPYSLMAEVADIRNSYEEYRRRKIYKLPLKSAYTMIMLMATLIILFSSIWVGFQLARGITVPIQKLAEGTREVAAGNLDYKVEAEADDEIKILVDSFNQMTGDLQRNKAEIEKVNLDLTQSNLDLERGKHYIETVLDNTAAGVFSLDRENRRLGTMNKAAVKMLKLKPERIIGLPYKKAFCGPGFIGIRSLIEKLQHRYLERYRREIRLEYGTRLNTFLASGAVLRDGGQNYLGLVVVLEDLTHLIKAQKSAAWREVAQRIAHEIKNPLTPILLCTQRLRRKFEQGAPEYSKVLKECSDTIIREVDNLKALVNEFSDFARMPGAVLQPTDLDKVIRDTVALYSALPAGINITTQLSQKLPFLHVDPLQMRRLLVNLIDNAIQATNGSNEIKVNSFFDTKNQTTRIEVADQGNGIPPEDQEKLFLPYFSTKKSGTGLGLAIVHRIVNEHHGSIRVKENRPRGAKFIIELPGSLI